MRRLALLVFLFAALPGAAAVDSRIVALRVHGNYTVPDEEVLRIAGVAEGAPFPTGAEAVIEERLIRSGKFADVDVRVRYRSFSESSEVALVIVVREKTSLRRRLMVAPLLELTDEYGLTYGGRVALVDVAVDGSRIAAPLSWGGARQAGVATDFPLSRRSSVRLDVLRSRREHPHFDVPENRLEAGGGVIYRPGFVTLGLRGRWSSVDLDAPAERFATLGASFVLDSRRDPTLPGDAFYAGLDWRRLFFLEAEGRAPARADVDRRILDLRGYKRLGGPTLLAVQAYWTTASGALPPYEQPFLGGGQTLRGFAPGRFLGDEAALGTVELRVPLTPVGSFARAGVHGFYDIGAAYAHGLGVRKARFHDALGVGAFFKMAVVGIRVDWGFALEGGNRFHVASDVKF